VYWKDDLVQAHLESSMPQHIRMDWWYGQPLEHSDEFVFSIDEGAPELDNYLTDDIVDLYSEKLISILEASGSSFDVFPASIFSKRERKILNKPYKVFRLREISDCLDMSKSEFELFLIGEHHKEILRKPVFTQEFLQSGKLLTRIRGFEKYVVIHADLKKIIETNGITGCDFQTARLDNAQFFG
jgi:hypothetical protein